MNMYLLQKKLKGMRRLKYLFGIYDILWGVFL